MRYAVVVEEDVLQADVAQLLREHPLKRHLARRAGACGDAVVGARVDADVAEEAIEDSGHGS